MARGQIWQNSRKLLRFMPFFLSLSKPTRSWRKTTEIAENWLRRFRMEGGVKKHLNIAWFPAAGWGVTFFGKGTTGTSSKHLRPFAIQKFLLLHARDLLFRNTPSTAGNSMTSSERPSPEPLLKKEAPPAVLGGREFWKRSGSLKCLEL